LNFYPHNIGDYAASTQHLTWIEDAAYRRLLDVYYGREEKIPKDFRKIYRLVRASSKAEREAVDTILREYFVEHEDGWLQHRCEEEIARFKHKQEAAKRSANARWGNANASETEDANAPLIHSEGICDGNAPNPNPNPNKNNSGVRLQSQGAVDNSAKPKTRAPVKWWMTQAGIVAKAEELAIDIGSKTYDMVKAECFAKIEQISKGKAA
jgi:uncharacterized protein YdaU (DUF1376 family)